MVKILVVKCLFLLTPSLQIEDGSTSTPSNIIIRPVPFHPSSSPEGLCHLTSRQVNLEFSVRPVLVPKHPRSLRPRQIKKKFQYDTQYPVCGTNNVRRPLNETKVNSVLSIEVHHNYYKNFQVSTNKKGRRKNFKKS